MGQLESYEVDTGAEDLVNVWRMAHGDLEAVVNGRGFISRAVPVRLTIIKELIRRGIFPYHWEVYSIGFCELRNAFLSPWGVRSSAVLLEQWGVGVSTSRADSIYQAVARGLGARRSGLVQYLVEEPKEKEVRAAHSIYKDCLERLVAIMDEEREKLYQERNAAVK